MEYRKVLFCEHEGVFLDSSKSDDTLIWRVLCVQYNYNKKEPQWTDPVLSADLTLKDQEKTVVWGFSGKGDLEKLDSLISSLERFRENLKQVILDHGEKIFEE